MKKFKRAVAFCAALAVASCSFAIAACGDGSQSVDENQEVIDNITTGTSEATYNSADISGSIDVTAAESGTMTLDGEIDLTTFDADMQVQLNSGDREEYGYMYMRDMKAFASSETYTAKPDVADMKLDDIGVSLSEVPLAQMFSELNAKSVAAISTLANRYDAITSSEGSISVNFMSLIGGIYDEVTSIINSLTDETTISQLYSNGIFKNVLDAANIIIDTQTAYTLVMSMMVPGDSSSVTDIIPAPAEGQSIYDYINSLLNNQQLSAALGLTSTIGELPLVGLMQAMTGSNEITAELIKEEFALAAEQISVSDSQISFPVGGEGYVEDDGNGNTVSVQWANTVTISQAQITYNFGEDNAITSENIAFDFSYTFGEDQTTVSFQGDITIAYSAAAIQVSDIGSAQVVVGTGASGEDITTTLTDYLENGGTINQSEFVGTYKFKYISVSDDNGQIVTINAGESYGGITFTENSWVLVVNEDNTFTLSQDLNGDVDSVSGTWSSWGNGYEYDLTVDGLDLPVQLSGNQVVIIAGGSVIVLEKV